MHSMRTKVSLITVAAILTTVLSILTFSYLTVEAENDRTSQERLTLLARNTQLSLDTYLTSITQSVEMVSNIATEDLDATTLVEGGVVGAGALRPRTPEQVAALDAYLSAYTARVQDTFGSVANHTQGVITYYYCLSPEMSETEHGFFYSKVGKTGFCRRDPIDARELDPADLEHTTWYYTPIERGRPSWVGPYTAHFLNELWTLSYLVPIYKAGTFVGVLGMDIAMDTLVAQVSDISVYDTGFACLLDADGNVLYHPSLNTGETVDFSDLTSEAGNLWHPDNPSTSVRYTDASGRQMQMAASPLASNMLLIVTAPVAEIMGSWTRLIHLVVFTAAAIVALFSAILFAVMGLMTRPLRQLTAASARLADGDYDVELAYRGHDEVGQLTGAFIRMRDEVRASMAELERRATTDELTGLPNLETFAHAVSQGRAAVQAAGGDSVLLYLNLIGMRYYNQQYGFDEGSALLVAFAGLIRDLFGQTLTARISQDQFCALGDARDVEDRLLALFEGVERLKHGRALHVRVGIYPMSLEDVEPTVACDRAKYASDMHRNALESAWYYFDRHMIELEETYRYVTTNFDRALREQWIKVYYQPIVRATTGQVCDEEALARWIDPSRGLLSPAEFIPVLEGSRLIWRLDLYVLDQILAKLARMRRLGLTLVPQSLNLSRVDFEATDIVSEVTRRVDAARISRDLITIEITESIVGQDPEHIKRQVERFQALGFKVWMDDFGSGYSSLNVLQDFHFDLLKLDMRFLEHFDEGNDGKVVVRELVRMAMSLGTETVVEGVETADQVQFLREVGCTKLQGYHFGRPVPFEEVVKQDKAGSHLGFENDLETPYYESVGAVNLYDVASVSAEETEELQRYFDTVPMAVMEVGEGELRIARCNRSFREFCHRMLSGIPDSDAWELASIKEPMATPLKAGLDACKNDGGRASIDVPLSFGRTAHAILRHVATNQLNDDVAIVVAVLGIDEGR